MKKLIVLSFVVVFGLTLTTAVFAAWNRGPWVNPGEQTDVNAFRNFQNETLSIRDEMAVKRLEIRNELNKETPDQTKIANLQKEMIDLRTKISDVVKKNGLSNWGYGRGYGRGGWGPGYGRGHHMGWGNGYGPGYGRGYCPMWQ